MSGFRCLLLASMFAVTAGSSADAATLSSVPGQDWSLTLDVVPTLGWEQQQAGNLVAIRFPDMTTAIDTSEFETGHPVRLVREVHSEIRGADTFVFLTLSCDCSLVIDDSTGSGLHLTISEAATQEAGAMDIVTGSVTTNALVKTGPAPQYAPSPRSKPDSTNNTENVNSPQSTVLDVDAAREELLAQLQRAASAGIINFSSPSKIEPDDAHQTPRVETSDLPQSAEEPSLGDTKVAQNKRFDDTVAKISEVRIEHPDEHAEQHSEVAEQICMDSEVLSFPDTFGAADFTQKLSVLNAGLTTEFDAVDQSTALDLAQLYLSLGLTVEALAVLESFATNSAQAASLIEIAVVLSGGDLPERASLSKPECHRDHALWRGYYNSLKGNSQAALADEKISGNALDRLPFYLRQRLAAQLGLAAVDQAAWDDARRLQALSERAARSGDEVLAETYLLSSRLAEWNEDEDRALELLYTALEKSPEDRDQILIGIARKILRSEDFIGEDTTALEHQLADLSQRFRGTAFGEEANELEARLYNRRSTRQETLEMLSAAVEAGTLGEESFTPIMTSLITGPFVDGASKPLAEVYLDDPEKFDVALQQDGFRQALIRSMADVGVPTLAKPLLRSVDFDDPDLVADLAGAFLRESFPGDALDLAQYLPPGEQQNYLTASALLDSGRADLAAPYLEKSSVPGEESPVGFADLLSEQYRAALMVDDSTLANEALNSLIALDPSVENAEAAIMLALENGAAELPPAARSILETESPERLQQIEQLFAGTSGEMDTDELGDFLKSTSAETQMLKELMNDG